MLPQAASDFYATQQRVNAVARLEVRRAWDRGMGDDFDASWRRVGPTILAILTEAQAQMVDKAVAYVPALLAETGVPDRPSGDLRSSSLVGVSSDGRPLDSLAYGGVTQAKTAAGAGAETGAALKQGGDWLNTMTALQVADAARTAVGVLTTSRNNLGGTVRVLNPPSCQRCAILSGRFYRWSKGFDRHPKCDCVNQPVPSQDYALAEGFITSPMDMFKRGEISDLTSAQAMALEDGADIGQVVNAYRGISTTSRETAASIRARLKAEEAKKAAGERVVQSGQPDLLGFLKPRPSPASPVAYPTPEAIYANTKSRADAIDQLRHWGYLT